MNATRQTIDRLAKTLQELKPLKAEYQQRLDKKIRLEFNYNSNHIEGNTLTYGETELLIIFDKTTGNHEMREYEEMKAHDVAFELVKEWSGDRERPLTEMAIKNLHEILLVKPYWKEAQTPDGQSTRRLIKVGDYKAHPNSVLLQNGEIFNYTSPEETPIEMAELIQWYRNEETKKELHVIELAALFHYKFVRIHPFDDGNGRLSRLLMNYILFKSNLPPVIIKSADKKNYLFALNQADTGDLDAFIEYVAEQLLWSLDISIRAAKGESIDEIGDLNKKLLILKKKLGEDPMEAVKYVYGNEAFGKLVEETIQPLCEAWSEKLKGFDTIIISRSIRFNAGSTNFSRKISEHFENFFLEFLKDNPAKKNLRNLNINCNVRGLRNINNTVSINGGQIDIALFHNAYEISFTNGDKRFNKLYHQPLKPQEINLIVETLGTFLYNNIEQFIESNQ